jgi:hypothetical protein
MNSVTIIEDVDDTGTAWYLSFDGPSPSDDMCVRCVDRAAAFKLKGLIDAAAESAYDKGADDLAGEVERQRPPATAEQTRRDNFRKRVAIMKAVLGPEDDTPTPPTLDDDPPEDPADIEPRAGGLGMPLDEAVDRYAPPAMRESLRRLADPAHRAAFNAYPGQPPRITVLDPAQHPHRPEAARMREHINAEFGLSITTADLACALRISEEDMVAIEAGTKTTDADGWKEMLTTLFLLGSGMKPEHIADPQSDPSFWKALGAADEDEPDSGREFDPCPEAPEGFPSPGAGFCRGLSRSPAAMDAPEGPRCGCGLPSTAQSGWCGTECEVRRERGGVLRQWAERVGPLPTSLLAASGAVVMRSGKVDAAETRRITQAGGAVHVVGDHGETRMIISCPSDAGGSNIAFHYAPADAIEGTACGLRWTPQARFRWTDDPEDVEGCETCGAAALAIIARRQKTDEADRRFGIDPEFGRRLDAFMAETAPPQKSVKMDDKARVRAVS